MEEKSRIIKKLNNDHSRPVLFNESFGGSENQLRLLLDHLSDENFKDINLILNNTDSVLLEKNRINILWMQHFVNQKEAQNLGSKEYVDKLDYIVFNSNWNFEKFYYQFKIPESKSLVIKNAIEKIEFKKKTRDKTNLIYHTTPWRGLVHLLKVFKSLNLENVELNVCSSTKIYGKKFYTINAKTYENMHVLQTYAFRAGGRVSSNPLAYIFGLRSEGYGKSHHYAKGYGKSHPVPPCA